MVFCAACGPRHDEAFDLDDWERPDRIAADPTIGGGTEPPPPREPPPPGSATVSEVRPFATATPGIYEMALDATHLYWITDGTHGPSEVWRANRDTAELALLATSTERVYALAIDEEHVYFTETSDPAYLVDGGRIRRVPKSGGTADTVVDALDNPTSVAVDETHVYFTRAYSPDGEVLRAAKAGGAVETLLIDVDNPWDIAVDATHVYVSEMNRSQILRIPKAGGAREVLASGWLGTGWMAAGPAGVYFQTCSVGTCGPAMLRSVPLAGGDVSLLHESSYDVVKVAFGGAYVLWGRWFVPLDGTAVTGLLEPSSETFAPIGVAGDDRAVFIANHPSGEIFTASVTTN